MILFKYLFCRDSSSQCNRLTVRDKIFWTPGNTCVLFAAIAVLFASSTAICSTTFSPLLDSSDTSISAKEGIEEHPTSLPWIETESECTHTTKNFKRTWSQGKCWDYEHSPTF